MSPIKSMTGFGRAEETSAVGTLAMEIKSVNHRYLEPKIFLPRELSMLEMPLMQHLKNRLSRGKVDVSVRFTPAADYAPRARINKTLIERYEVEIARVAGDLQRQERVPLEVLLNLPGVLEKELPSPDEAGLMELAEKTLTMALDALVQEREREGALLAAEIGARLNNLEDLRRAIAVRSPEVTDSVRQRFLKKVEEWSKSASLQMDPGRLEAEVLLFADRADVTEELVRLEAHIGAFHAALNQENGEPQGRAMEFLTQELLREANTIASKSRDTAIASMVLSMKNEIEKIREQVLNIE